MNNNRLTKGQSNKTKKNYEINNPVLNLKI